MNFKYLGIPYSLSDKMVKCLECNYKTKEVDMVRYPPTVYTLFECENKECGKLTVRVQDYEDSGNIPVEWRLYGSIKEFYDSFESKFLHY